MFYTPGWGAVLTLTGTLAGVAITQAVNSAISWGTRRKERNASITKAASEVIGSAHAWVYATSAQEQDLFRDVATRVPEEKLMENLESSRASVYSAQLAFGSAIAVVRLTCPPKVVRAAEDVHEAVQDFEAASRAKGEVALKVRRVDGLEGTDPAGIVGPVDRLVDVTRRATGFGDRQKS
jgi:hypothetical protein